MEFGMFHEFQWSPGASEIDAFSQSFAQVDAAESWGLDAMWLAELHLAPYRSVLSSPLIVATAIAARTRRMKIGTAVQVLPLCHPLRLAEEVATLDQISDGRVIFGVGRSGFQFTYDAYGVSYAESRDRFAADPGDPEARLDRPELLSSRALLPLRQAQCRAEAAAKALPAHPHRRHQRRYPCERSARSGTPSSAPRASARFPSSRPTSAAIARPTRPPAIPAAARSISASPSTSRRRRSGRATSPRPASCDFTAIPASGSPRRPRPACDHRDERRRAASGLQSVTYEEALRDKVIVGTPATVVDRLKGLQDELGLDGILAELNSGSLIPHERVMNAFRLLCEEVMPHFK